MPFPTATSLVVPTKRIATLSGREYHVKALAWRSDGLLASGDGELCDMVDGPGTIKLWRDGQCIATLNHRDSVVHAVAWRSDGILASGGGDNTIALWG